MNKFSDNYPMLKEYKDIKTYMEELRHYANISETIELDRIEAQKQIIRDKKEIERLNENNQAMQEEMARTWRKLDKKENIIKEVREYIEQLLEYKKTNKVIHKEYIERIIDIINQDKRY